ncbi:MAG TPA: CoA transferase [Novosphingobium sp.]|nr:CoA transferase [Novosphingobium sp.]
MRSHDLDGDTAPSSTRAQEQKGARPLDGIKVVDLTSVVMGPYATQIMADFGADVIKVENAHGDTTRFMPGSLEPGMGGTFLNLNRGKRSIVLDLKSPAGRDALMKLVRDADVFVHSMRATAIARLDLGYETVAAVNPNIVYCNMYGFGRQGRYRDLAAYDDVIQAACGSSMLQGMQNGAPAYVTTAIADKVTALTGLYSIMMALFHKERTGEGQEIEIPMFETMVSFNFIEHIGGAFFTPPVTRPYYDRVVSKLRRPYSTSDGYISALVYNDKQWRAFVEIAGLPEGRAAEDLETLAQRLQNIDCVYQHVETAMATRTTEEWLALFDQKGIPAMPLLSLEDLLEDEHLKDVDFFEERDTRFGKVRFPGIPTWFSKTPAHIGDIGPALGEHSEEVLREHGFGEAELSALLPMDGTGSAGKSRR